MPRHALVTSQPIPLEGVIPSATDRLENVGKYHQAVFDHWVAMKSRLPLTAMKHERTLLVEPELAIRFSDDLPGDEFWRAIPLHNGWPRLPLLYPSGFARLRRPRQALRRSDWLIVERTEKQVFEFFTTLHEKLPPGLPFTVLEFGIRNAHPEIAILATQVPEFMDLLKSNPQLAVLYAWSRVSPKTTPDVVRDEAGPPVRSGARRVVESMKLPARPVILRLLRRLTLGNLPVPQTLQRVLTQKDYPELLLNLNAPIKTNTLSILARFSFPLTSQLVREINAPSREFIERRGSLSRLFGDTRQMMATLEMPFDVFSQIRSLNRVARLHDEVVAEWNREESRILGLSGDTALPCPVGCPEWVEPLASIDVVRAAATEFRNCARIYIMRVWHREYYLFKVRGDNREVAMLGVKLLPNEIQFHQLEAPSPRRNRISRELRARVNEWVENLQRIMPVCPDYKRFIAERKDGTKGHKRS